MDKQTAITNTVLKRDGDFIIFYANGNEMQFSKKQLESFKKGNTVDDNKVLDKFLDLFKE
jgi:hypothetical protein